MYEYLNTANGAVMWLACAPAVLLVALECILFYKKSRVQADKLGIDPKLIKVTMKTSAITAIGPTVVVIATVLALINYVGVPLAWMRNSIIGNAQEELLAAEMTADACGLALDPAGLDMSFVTSAAFVMAVGMCGYLLTSALFADKVTWVSEKFSGGNAALLPMITLGAVLGGMSNIMVGNSLPLSVNTVGAVVGAGMMFVVQSAAKKKPNAVWLKEWGMTIAMFTGMIIAYVISLNS